MLVDAWGKMTNNSVEQMVQEHHVREAYAQLKMPENLA